MNTRRLRQTFLDLLQLNAPSRREKRVADYVKRAMREAADGPNDEQFEDRAGKAIGGNANNLVFRLQGTSRTAPPLVLLSHMDTVEPTPRIHIERRGTVVQSDGTTVLGADDKAGIAVMIEAARTLRRKRRAYSAVEFVFSVAEEVGLLGVENFDYGLIDGRLGLVLDSNTPVGSIVTSAPSSDHVEIRVKGRKAHAGVEPEKGVNAIAVAAKAIARLKQGRLDEETTANIGVIEGGTASNIVADEVLVKGEARSFSERKLDRWITHMKSAFLKEAEAAGAEVQIETARAFTTFDIPKTHPLVRATAKAARAAGRRGKILRSGGGSDANVFNGHGITSVVLGLGYKDPHTKQESLDLLELDAAARWVIGIVEALGLTKAKGQ